MLKIYSFSLFFKGLRGAVWQSVIIMFFKKNSPDPRLRGDDMWGGDDVWGVRGMGVGCRNFV